MSVTYMCQVFHNLHLIVDLLVQYAVLHEASLVQLFRCEDCSVLLGSKLVHGSERALADLPGHIVCRSACPMHAMAVSDGP